MIILLGGGTVLCRLIASLAGHGRPVVVVTSPRHAEEVPDQIGRSLRDVANASGVELIVTDDVNREDRVLMLASAGATGLSFGAGWIFSATFIELFGGRLFNFHGARLPQNRGGGGFSWPILSGSRLGYALVHRLEPGIDTGAIVFVREFVFPNHCRLPIDFYRVLASEYEAMLPAFLSALDAGAVEAIAAQPEHLSSYWPRLSTEHHGWIDWMWSARDIERFICAFDDPYAGASTMHGQDKVLLKSCVCEVGDGEFHPFQAGLIYRKSPVGLFVASRGGSLVIQRATDDQGISVLDRLRLGDRLHTPASKLDEARGFRATYTPAGLKTVVSRS